jgi:hypothetical protein
MQGLAFPTLVTAWMAVTAPQATAASSEEVGHSGVGPSRPAIVSVASAPPELPPAVGRRDWR